MTGGSEISFPICDGSIRLRGKCWGNPDAPATHRILAYSGWLDNVGSWYSSAKLYADSGYFFVAVDPVGCGISDHLPASSFYSDLTEVHHVIAVADYLNWKEPFILVGHSRGANLSCNATMAFPDRIRAVVAFDGSFTGFGGLEENYNGSNPTSQFDEPSDGGLRNIVLSRRKEFSRKTRMFKSLDEAVQRNNSHVFFKKTIESSRNIVSRHIKKLNGPLNSSQNVKRFTFTHDPKTYNIEIAANFSPAVNVALKKQARTPILMIQRHSTSWIPDITEKDFIERKLVDMPNLPMKVLQKIHQYWLSASNAAKEQIEFHIVRGNHHFHSDKPVECSKIVLPFLEKHIHKRPSDFMFKDERKLSFESYKTLLMIPDDEVNEKVNFSHNKGREFKIRSYRRTIGGCKWGGEHESERFLCVHDDQDNSSSFTAFANCLLGLFKNKCEIVAFDQQGRGTSGWATKDRFYSAQEELLSIADVADFNQWESFHLVCHGRGALIGILFSRWFPEKVVSLSLISGISEVYEPLSSLPDFAPSDIYYSFLEYQGKLQPQLPLKKYFRSSYASSQIERRDRNRDPRTDLRPILGVPSDVVLSALKRLKCRILLLNPENKQTRALKEFTKDDQMCKGLTRKHFQIGEKERDLLSNLTTVEKKIEGSRYLHIDNALKTTKELFLFIQKLNSNVKEPSRSSL